MHPEPPKILIDLSRVLYGVNHVGPPREPLRLVESLDKLDFYILDNVNLVPLQTGINPIRMAAERRQ